MAALIVVLSLKRAAPKAVPEEYEAPEIEIETFEKAGQVPDLDAIEAALLIGDTTKAVTLVLMRLTQRGVLTVANQKPLQLEVTKPDQELADYEQALVDGIAEDGTLPPVAVDSRAAGALGTAAGEDVERRPASDARDLPAASRRGLGGVPAGQAGADAGSRQPAALLAPALAALSGLPAGDRGSGLWPAACWQPALRCSRRAPR